MMLSEKTRLDDFLATAKGKVTVVNDRWAVSTVKLPVMAYGEQWESMVFPVVGDRVSFSERDCDRYSSEADSQAGHDAMVAKWALLDAAGKADGAMYPDDIPEG